MKKLLLSCVVLLPAGAWAMGLGPTEQSLMISSEGRCVQTEGIPIKEVPDSQVRLACLKDRTVQTTCNPDGQHARIEAFRQWEAQLMDFKERCATVGGAFAFAAQGFKEPTDETFCSLAQPEVTYSAFETPMCNFVSRCPQVAVTCSRQEDTLAQAQRTVLLPGIPKAVSITSY